MATNRPRSSNFFVHKLGGAFTKEPADLQKHLSKDAKKLVYQVLQDIWKLGEIVDYHTHILGLGTSGSNCFIQDKTWGGWNWKEVLRFAAFMTASGVSDKSCADQQYVERLVKLVQNTVHPQAHFLLAFDKYYNEDGTPNIAKSEMYTSNEYIYSICQQYPNLFIPTCSVHPYRKDALQELERCSKLGIRMCKWLPNAQGIDPSHELCVPFYKKLVELDIVLLSHTGHEHSVGAMEQIKGNPLLLRKALDIGVKVIAAHCATSGLNIDLDNPAKPEVYNFDLFLRLMAEKKYENNLWGDISAITSFKRLGYTLNTLLDRTDLHPRLLYGSDYPVPAVNVVVRTNKLLKYGYITAEERLILNEIYDYNILLFDLVVKRTIKSPSTGNRFSPSIFVGNPKVAYSAQRNDMVLKQFYTLNEINEDLQLVPLSNNTLVESNSKQITEESNTIKSQTSDSKSDIVI